MSMPQLPLTPELRQAFAAQGGLPLEFVDPETQQAYILSEPPIEMTLDEAYVREALDKGLADIEAGRVGPWDPERIKREGRERLAARRSAE